jgi:hypothetical protein
MSQMEKRALKALRQARLYGHLVARHGRLFHPGGGNPLCDVQTSKEIVRSGLLKYRDGKYVLAPEGLRVLAASEGRDFDATATADGGSVHK